VPTTLTTEIEAVLAVLRPVINDDGGDIELVDVLDGGVVRVRLTGACGTCEMSQLTLKSGVERILRDRVPAVTEVVAVDAP
jgi:Fe-S cluster biogenesis protein NfuA